MLTPEQRGPLIAAIAALPAELAALTADLDAAALDQRTSADPWTIRQVVHHVADSHINSFVRTKLMLTEDVPALKPYDQDAWATLADTALPLAVSLAILDGLHQRWVRIFETLDADQWQRGAFHPERGTITLDDILTTYVEHGAEHLAQIRRILAALPAPASA